MTSKKMKRWDETDELLSRMSVRLYGFDTTKLNWRDQQAAEEIAWKRRLLEMEAKRRNNSKPEREMTTEEFLEERRVSLLLAKFEKIGDGKPLKDISNEELKQQMDVLRSI